MSSIAIVPRPAEAAVARTDETPALPTVAAPLAPAPKAPFAVKLIVCIFVSAYVLVGIRLLFNLWGAKGEYVSWILGLGYSPLATDVVPIAHVVLGAMLGAGVLDLVSFHHYVSEKDDFQTRHVWGYFFGPIMSTALSIVIYTLLRTGLLVFSGGGASEVAGKEAQIANYGYLAVGFLSGFGWYDAVENIRATIKRFFGSGAEKQNHKSDDPVEPPVAGSAATDTSAQAQAASPVAASPIVPQP